MADILVLAAHPQMAQSRITHRLMHAAAQADPARIEVRDLYALYPDFFIDVAAEQAALSAARLLVWLHPVQWYAQPALLKLWLDEVWAYGWAYGPGGRALAGKDLWQVCSSGGPQASYRPDGYNRYFFDAFTHPQEQAAALVGMRWLPPLVLYGAHRATDAELQAHAELFAQRLQSWPDWPETADLLPAEPCPVPADARPAHATGATGAKTGAAGHAGTVGAADTIGTTGTVGPAAPAGTTGAAGIPSSCGASRP